MSIDLETEPLDDVSVAKGDSTSSGIICQGTVISVNPATHEVAVALDNVAQGPFDDVQICSLYCHPQNGEGVYFLPEAGSTCLVFDPSDGSVPFILGFVMPPTAKEGYSGGRLNMNVGDIILMTRDDNHVILRRGGLVEIGSTPLAQRLYIPLTHFIKDFFENYEALSPSGKISWTRDVKTDQVKYVFQNKDLTTDLHNTVELEFFADTDQMPEGAPDIVEFPLGPSYMRFRIKSLTRPEITFQMSKSGDLYAHTEGYVFLKSEKKLRIQSGAEISLKGPNYDMKVTTAGVMSESALKITMSAKTTAELSAKVQAALTAPQVCLGSNRALHPVVHGDALYAWLTALLSPLPGVMSSKKVMALHISTCLANFPFVLSTVTRSD